VAVAQGTYVEMGACINNILAYWKIETGKYSEDKMKAI